MLETIKKELSQNPDKIISILETFGFGSVKNHGNYLSFGRDEHSSAKAVVMYLVDNPYCMVNDYPRSIRTDIINYICIEKGVSFRTVVETIKNGLGIDGIHVQKKEAFNGFFSKVKKRKQNEIKIYDEKILKNFDPAGNERFLMDNISLKAQRFFNIGFDKKTQSITIPIYNDEGKLIGVKARRNKDIEDGELKYFYLYPVQMSQTLYGIFQNYQYLSGTDTIYVFEAEKSVLQAYDFGVRTCVSLGSSSLSRKQGLMIYSLAPRKVVFMFDKGLSQATIDRNCELFKSLIPMSDIDILVWHPDESVPDKSSPTDLGKEKWDEIMKERISLWKEN